MIVVFTRLYRKLKQWLIDYCRTLLFNAFLGLIVLAVLHLFTTQQNTNLGEAGETMHRIQTKLMMATKENK